MKTITVEEAAQKYFDEYFERFDGRGVAIFKETQTIPAYIDQSEWENFWLALDDIEARELLKDIHNAGRPEEERI